jgi:peroxiredoxin
MLSKTSKWILPIAIIGILAFLGLSIADKAKAPAVTFVTIEGKNIPLSSLSGQVVLVNFWATDCPGCIAEMPGLIKTYNDYHEKGFEVIAVAMSYDPPSQVLNYTKKNALPFPVMHDGYGEIAKQFNEVRVTPTAYILDKQGKVLRKVVGELNFTDLHKLLDEQLKKPA